MSAPRTRTRPRARTGGLGLLVVSVVLIGLTLRGPIVGVPPLLSVIQEDLGLGSARAGLLTSLPLLAFAVLSPFVSYLVQRLGVERTILLSLVMLGTAMALRPWLGAPGLLIGTAVVGVAITIGNVVVPVLVRRDAGDHVSTVMAASTGSYGIGQTLVVLLAVPVAGAVGWRSSLSLPVVLVLAALTVWIVRMVIARPTAPPRSGPRSAASGHGWRHVWHQKSAWWLALFFGLQALLFYTASTWMPTQLADTASLDAATAGTAVSVFHLLGIAGTFLVPVLLRRTGNPRLVGTGVAVGWFGFFVGIFAAPAAWALWMAFGGLVQGVGIGLGLTLIAQRPVDPGYGRYLSGMVQGTGYALAAVGPVLIGWLATASSGWLAPTGALTACSLLMIVAARFAGDRRKIGV